MTPAVMLGQGVGDALGMPFETLGDTVHDDLLTWDGSFKAGTFHSLPAGHWTDDTEMAVELATSLIKHGMYDPQATAERYLKWIRGTPHGAGGTTKSALKAFGDGASWNECGIVFVDPDLVGSGPAMRAAPLGVFFRTRDGMFNACRYDAMVTHKHVEAFASSFAVAQAVYAGLNGYSGAMLIGFVHDAVLRCEQLVGPRVASTKLLETLKRAIVQIQLDMHPLTFANDFAGRRGNAWQIASTAIYCAAFYDNFRDGVISAVRIGGDADTRGAIAGAILGARFGIEGIPEEYVKDVLGRDMLMQLDRDLLSGGKT